jgi:UDP-N-acetyl-2-amino-2-deoxyglucuronate dehydrogenase
MSHQLKVVIVGLGHLHPRLYLPLFAAVPATQVTAVVEQNPLWREPFAREFGLAAYADLDAMLSAERPDIAAIFLPHADCPAAAVRCTEKGVHVMVEKPAAASAAGARSIVSAVRRAGLKMTTGYCWRFHPVAREIKRLIASGVLGEIIGGEGRCAAGRLTRYVEGNAGWMLEKARAGGGPMYNLGVHWIDLFRWLLADEVAEVSGRNVKVNPCYDIEDNSFAHLRFRRGSLVALDVSYTMPDSFPYGRDLYIALRGTKGVLSWAPAFEGQRDVLQICSDDATLAGSPFRQVEFNLEAVPGYAGCMGRDYVRAFADAVLTGSEPPITGEDAVAALEVVETIDQAAAERRWLEVQRSEPIP